MVKVRTLRRFRDSQHVAHDPGDLFECSDDDALAYADRGEVEILDSPVQTSAPRPAQPEATSDDAEPERPKRSGRKRRSSSTS